MGDDQLQGVLQNCVMTFIGATVWLLQTRMQIAVYASARHRHMHEPRAIDPTSTQPRHAMGAAQPTGLGLPPTLGTTYVVGCGWFRLSITIRSGHYSGRRSASSARIHIRVGPQNRWQHVIGVGARWRRPPRVLVCRRAPGRRKHCCSKVRGRSYYCLNVQLQRPPILMRR